MSTLKKTIEADFITAFKAKDADRKMTLSMVKAKITEAEKKEGKELTDADVIAVVQSYSKQLDQTIASAPDSVAATAATAEKVFLSPYLPQMLTDEFIEIEARSVLSEMLGPGKQMIGAVMKHFKENFPGQYDAKALSTLAAKLTA